VSLVVKPLFYGKILLKAVLEEDFF